MKAAFSLVALAGAGIALAAAAPAAAQLRVDKRADLAAPVALEPGQGAILLAFRRPDRMSQGKSGMLSFARYDPAGRDLILQPRGAKKQGDKTTYWVNARSGDRKLALDHMLMVVSEGDYVLFGATPGAVADVTNTFCLGAPTFRVNAGEIVYFGDVTPYTSVKLVDGETTAAMAFSSHYEDAAKALSGQPALAAALRPAELRNGASYACFGQAMMAYAVPGAPALEPVAPAERQE